MNKRSHRFIALLLVVLMITSMTVSAAAASIFDTAVVYNGSTRVVEFRNFFPFLGNEQPDLFPDMKELMPGDSVKQEITIGAVNMGVDSVRIWLRSENPNADYTKLMETYGHWITFRVSDGKEEFTGDLAEGVKLGTFSSNGKKTITVELAIDILADNALKDLTAEIDWVFTAEVIPGSEPPAPDPGAHDLPWLLDAHVNYLVGYTDGTVRPDQTITRAETATIFYRLLTEQTRSDWFSTDSAFSDVSTEDWFCTAVCTLTEGKILTGYPDGTFRPNDPISRAELAAIISRFDTTYNDTKATASFRDVTNHWAKDPIEFAATRGYVFGYPDDTFKPDRSITRAETVTMMNRALHRAVDKTGLKLDHDNWTDNRPGTWYYYEIIEAANYHSYERSKRDVENQSYCYENWAHVLPPIDWATAERRLTMAEIQTE